MKIPLFDIDGTLFKTANPIHIDAFTEAFKNVYRVDANQKEISPEGMLDNQIIIDVLKLHGFSEERIKEKLKTATMEMSKFVRSNLKDGLFTPLPGVKGLLKELKSKNIPLGILSGNVEDIAWSKIENAGLADYFQFGGFGDEAFKRVDLIDIARVKAEKVLNKSLEIKDFVIVGDTPKDIKCARDGGIKVIAVTTGIYSYEYLEKEKPDLLLRSMEEKAKVLDFLDN